MYFYDTIISVKNVYFLIYMIIVVDAERGINE